MRMVDAESEPVVRRRTVLVVDDDPGTRHVMASGIGEVLGTFDVVTAENGEEATEILETRRVDALATDLAMPIMDGFSLIAYVSNRKEALPVVAFSGLAASEIDERLSTYGGLRVLRKPVSYHEVAAALEDELGRIEKGQVEGIPLVALLQLVEIERRTCTVVVTSDRRRGRLHFQSGRLIDAYSDDFGADGEAAAYDVLGWKDTSVAFDALPSGIRPKIGTPLQRMLLEVAAAQDVAAPAVPPSPPDIAAAASGGGPSAAGRVAVANGPGPERDGAAAFEPEASPDRADGPPLGSAGGDGVAHAGGSEADEPSDANRAVSATPPDAQPTSGSGGAGAAAPDAHVAELREAVARLTARVQEADTALAAVADEIDAFRRAHRDFEAVNAERERRRRELEAFRDEVGDLARALVDRVDAMLAPKEAGGTDEVDGPNASSP